MKLAPRCAASSRRWLIGTLVRAVGGVPAKRHRLSGMHQRGKAWMHHPCCPRHASGCLLNNCISCACLCRQYCCISHRVALLVWKSSRVCLSYVKVFCNMSNIVKLAYKAVMDFLEYDFTVVCKCRCWIALKIAHARPPLVTSQALHRQRCCPRDDTGSMVARIRSPRALLHSRKTFAAHWNGPQLTH